MGDLGVVVTRGHQLGDADLALVISLTSKYLLANAAFLSWFARQSPSTAIGGLYDLGGIFSTYSTAY